MNNNDLSDMSALWQQQTTAPPVDFARLHKRSQRQRLQMILTVGLESVILTTVTLYLVFLLLTSANIPQLMSVSVFTLWGWALFIALNSSRWRSFQLIKSVTVHDSLASHCQLLLLEERRWQLSFYATLGLTLLQVVFMAVSMLHEPFSAVDWWASAVSMLFLVLAMVWFRVQRNRARRARIGLQS